MILRYLIATLAVLFFALPAAAGGNHHNNATTNTAAAVATGGTSSAVSGDNTFIGLPSGASAGLSNGWQCSVSYSVTLGPVGFGGTDESEACLKHLKAQMACRFGHPECGKRLGEFLAYEPAESAEPSVAAE